MCIPWQVAHVRFVGLPSPTVFRCIESRIQNVRNMNTSCPRAIDFAPRCAFSDSLAVRGSRFHFPPIGNTKRVVLLPSTPASPRQAVAGRTLADHRPRPGCRPAARHLRHIDLLFELDDARELRGRQPAFELEVLFRRVLRLHRASARARPT